VGTETLLQCIYAGQKYPHIYTLSISIVKNQSIKVCGVLYIPTMSTITKLSQDITQHYNIITSSIGAKCENTKLYTNMNSTEDAHELQKETSRDE